MPTFCQLEIEKNVGLVSVLGAITSVLLPHDENDDNHYYYHKKGRDT